MPEDEGGISFWNILVYDKRKEQGRRCAIKKKQLQLK
jgi:hypothetical protein